MNALSSFGNSEAIKGGINLDSSDFQAIAAILLAEARISLAPQKVTLVRSRLSRRLRAKGLNSYHDYVDLVRKDADERYQMVEALTTNHTHFFRESHHFDHLRDQLIPQLRAHTSAKPIRIWSSASSSGEEVYSIAMCLLGKDGREAQWAKSVDLRLLATDISAEMVAATRKASYSQHNANAIPEPYRRLWTRNIGDDVIMADEARDMVSAMELNLFNHWPMQRGFDAIFCRNVMIYFEEDAKIELETRLIDQLLPGGILYIGHSERLLGPARDLMIPCGQTIYRKSITAGGNA
jgi:chemotaxis protein methyltransferase CheR